MSTSAKTGIALVIVLAVIVVVWIWFNSSNVPPTVVNTVPNASTPTPTPVDPLAGTGLSAVTDLSTDSLEKDAAALDAQISGLNGDLLGIDQSLGVSQ